MKFLPRETRRSKRNSLTNSINYFQSSKQNPKQQVRELKVAVQILRVKYQQKRQLTKINLIDSRTKIIIT